MLTTTALTARYRRPLTGALGAGLVLVGAIGVTAVAGSPASAEVRGQVTVNPASGNDETLFGGTATTDCPDSTDSSLWSVEGPGIEPFQGYLGEGTRSGDGRQEFIGGSIANLRTVNAGSFATTTQYRVVFSCITGPGATDTYEAMLNYTAGGGGAYTITPAVVVGPEPTVPPTVPPTTTPTDPPTTTPTDPPTTTPTDPPTVAPGVDPDPTSTAAPVTATGSPSASAETGVLSAGATRGGTGTGPGSSSGSTSGSLPRTGTETAALVALGTSLLGGGVALAFIGRRRSWFTSGAHQA